MEPMLVLFEVEEINQCLDVVDVRCQPHCSAALGFLTSGCWAKLLPTLPFLKCSELVKLWTVFHVSNYRVDMNLSFDNV